MKQTYILALLPLLALSSCSSDSLDSAGGPQEAPARELTIAAQVGDATRVHTDMNDYNTIFDIDDMVGIYIVKHGTDLTDITSAENSAVWLYNQPFKVEKFVGKTDMNGNPVLDAQGNQILTQLAILKMQPKGATPLTHEDVLWPDITSDYDVYAYYPYSASLQGALSEGIVHDVGTTQNGTDDNVLKKRDFLVYTGKVRGGTDIQMGFKHAMSLVETILTTDQITGVGNANTQLDGSSVTLNAHHNATVKFTKVGTEGYPCSITTNDQAGQISMQQAQYGTDATKIIYRAFVPAQTLEAQQTYFNIVGTENGGSTPKTTQFCILSKDFELLPGHYVLYDYNGNATNNALFPSAILGKTGSLDEPGATIEDYTTTPVTQ